MVLHFRYSLSFIKSTRLLTGHISYLFPLWHASFAATYTIQTTVAILNKKIKSVQAALNLKNYIDTFMLRRGVRIPRALVSRQFLRTLSFGLGRWICFEGETNEAIRRRMASVIIKFSTIYYAATDDYNDTNNNRLISRTHIWLTDCLRAAQVKLQSCTACEEYNIDCGSTYYVIMIEL